MDSVMLASEIHNFIYKGYHFRIGRIEICGTLYIYTEGKDLPSSLHCNTKLDIWIGRGNGYNSSQIVVINEPLIIKQVNYVKPEHSYNDAIRYLKELCKPEPPTIEEIYKECKGKTPEEVWNILAKYEIRHYVQGSGWGHWSKLFPASLTMKKPFILGVTELRRKEGNSDEH